MSTAMATALFLKGFLGAGLATLGFGVLFNVRNRNLLYAGLTGAVGGTIYEYCVLIKMSEGLACFLAALVIGILGEIFARKGKTTVTTFTACALIPLVPGGMAYEMMVDFTMGDISGGAVKFVSMLSVSGMLAFAILIVSTMTRFFFYSKRKVRHTAERLTKVDWGTRSFAFNKSSYSHRQESGISSKTKNRARKRKQLSKELSFSAQNSSDRLSKRECPSCTNPECKAEDGAEYRTSQKDDHIEPEV